MSIKINVDSYVLTPCKFIAGTRGSYGIETLDFDFSEEWSGLSVTVSFYPPGGEPVAVVYSGEPFNIPSEVMSTKGTSKFVVSGYQGTKALISAEGMIRVLDTSVPTDSEALTPTATQLSQVLGAVSGKVDKVTGKGLSENDYTTAEKNKLSGIESGAQANVQPDWAQTNTAAGDYVKNKPVSDSVPTANSTNTITSGGVYAALAGKSDSTHNHNAAYAAIGHNHTGVYSPSSHSHASSYAAIGHNHNSAYSAIGHNHDAVYAASGHNHDSDYAPKSGECAGLTAGLASNLSAVRQISVDGWLGKRVSAGGASDTELAAAKVKSIDGMSVVQLVENGNFADGSGWNPSGGDAAVIGGVCSLTPYVAPTPAAGGPSGSGTADYTIAVGESVIIEGYDPTMNTWDLSQEGIVEVIDTDAGDGWEIIGISAGTVMVTIYDCGDEIDSVTVEVTAASASAEPAEKSVSRAMSYISGHKYYISADIKSPAAAEGIKLVANDGTEHAVGCAASTAWQHVAGVFTATANAVGTVGIKDDREVSASIVYSSKISGASVDAVTFAKKVGAFSTAASKSYRFVYSGGWRLNGTGSVLTLALYGVNITWTTDTDSLRAGSVVTVNLVYPFNASASAAITSSGSTGLSGLTVDPTKFAGAFGTSASSGTYVFTYVSGTGWTYGGAAVLLSDYAITGVVASVASAGATITVTLSVTPETIYMRRVQAFDMTYLGLSALGPAEMHAVLGEGYHSYGLSNAVFGGIGSAGTEKNPVSSGVTFSAAYELRRLPDGTADTLDIENSKLYRRITLKTVTGSNGGQITLSGAESGTSYICAQGDIGSVIGNVLTLSKSVSGAVVCYKLASAQITNVSEPSEYSVATGGTETLLKYNSSTELYEEAPIAVRATVGYTPDYARQVELDRLRMLGLLSALGIFTSTDAEVSAMSTKISNALSAFITNN